MQAPSLGEKNYFYKRKYAGNTILTLHCIGKEGPILHCRCPLTVQCTVYVHCTPFYRERKFQAKLDQRCKPLTLNTS